MDRAIAFLLRARADGGWWRDFDTLAGVSDEWVSAYVAHALAGAPRAEARSAAQQTWRRLVRRRWWSPGWGYNRNVPADADSTLWAIALASALDVSGSLRVGRAMTFVGRHTREDGSVATYASSGPIRLFTRLGASNSFEGWCASHVCVTALAATTAFSTRARMLDFLRRSQRPTGCWNAYWWCDPEYATALAVRALVGNAAAPEDRGHIDRAAAWAVGRVGEPEVRTPFATALLLSILCACPGAELSAGRAACLSRLLDKQDADGAWPSSARLRIPPPHVVEPESYPQWNVGGRGGGSIVLDRSRCYTTATVLKALVHVERACA